MGRYIEIKKFKTTQNIHYYQVASPDFPQVNAFYIGLDPQHQSIYFFKNKEFDIPDHTIALNIQDKKIEPMDWLPIFLFYGTLVKARDALANNKFTEFISFQS
jgi:hypothetical protein